MTCSAARRCSTERCARPGDLLRLLLPPASASARSARPSPAQVQGHESDHLYAVFGGAIELVPAAGAASPMRLLHVGAGRNALVTQVDLAPGSVSADGVYVLDQGARLLQWSGPAAR